jgi:predicted dehydrogenase
MGKIRWGIISTGNIANSFAQAFDVIDDAEIVAVGSRSQESADAFGDKYAIPNRHASYEALVNDPDVDAVYIGTPHPFHKDNSLLAINAGKAVLCEKPFTVNAAEAQAVINAAQAKGVFLMEAVWTRFIPIWVKIRELIAEGAIGEIRMVGGDFGFNAPYSPDGRLFDPALAGGGLLDVGVYPINLAWMTLGAPETVKSMVHLGETGVDEQGTLLFGYPNGALAHLSYTLRVDTPITGYIAGTEGTIKIGKRWFINGAFTVERGDEVQTFELPLDGNGYEYEIREVGRCLREGLTESPIMPHSDSLAIMHLMDALRADWGLKYPME